MCPPKPVNPLLRANVRYNQTNSNLSASLLSHQASLSKLLSQGGAPIKRTTRGAVLDCGMMTAFCCELWARFLPGLCPHPDQRAAKEAEKSDPQLSVIICFPPSHPRPLSHSHHILAFARLHARGTAPTLRMTATPSCQRKDFDLGQ